ncbi:MAG: LamG-like jellyroll fold domain-containing protein [Candidatus Micrarchaeia archaeon]
MQCGRANALVPVLITFLAVSMLLAGIAHAAYPAGLVSYYPFDSNANDALGVNNGAASGSATLSSTGGIVRGAYVFNGGTSSSINLTYSSSLNLSLAGTIAMWVKPKWKAYNYSNSEIFFDYNVWGATGSGIACLFRPTDYGTGGIDCDIVNSSTSPVYSYYNTQNWNASEWHMLAFTYDIPGSSRKLYIDGVQVSSSTTAISGFSLPAKPIYIGMGYNGYSSFNGTIDEVAIFNRSLDATEVSQYYNYTKTSVRNYFGDCKEDCPSYGGGMAANNTASTAQSAYVNISIQSSTALSNFTFNWNGTNYYVYDDSLVGMWNFDDANYSDDFSQSAINATRWSNSGCAIQSGKLNCSTTAASWSTSEVYGLPVLKGDFDFQIDFDASGWGTPSSDGWQMTLEGRRVSTGQVFSCSHFKWYNGARAYDSWDSAIGASVGSTSTSQTSGKLRIVRTGTNISCYYWTGSAFALYASRVAADVAYDMAVDAYVTNRGSLQATSGTFDNFILTKGQPAADNSRSSNSGIILNSGWSFVSGKYGSQAIQLNGLDGAGVDVPNSASLQFGTSDVTFEAWVKPNNYSPQNWEVSYITQYNTSTPRHGYLLGIGGALSGSVQNKTEFLAGLGDSNGYAIYGASGTNNNQWRHIIASVQRNGYMRLYENGVETGNRSISANATQNESNGIDIGIGYNAYNTGRVLNGTLDNVRIYRRALSSAEAALAYASSFRKVDSTHWELTANLTNLSFGRYSIGGSAKSVNGYTDPLAASYIILGTASILNATPANGSAVAAGNATMNVSFQSQNPLYSFSWQFNGTSFTPYNSSLVALFNFDGVPAIGETGTAAKDSGPQGLSGTCSGMGGACTYATGASGSGMSFNTTSYVSLASDSYLPSGASGRTISFWMYPTTITTGARMFSYGNWSASNAFDIDFATGSNATNGVIGVIGDNDNYASNGTVPINAWSHVAIALGGGYMTIYINSNADSTQSASTLNTLLTGGEWRIGARLPSHGSIAGFNGTMDDFRIYNRTLSAQEVGALYLSSMRRLDQYNWEWLYAAPNAASGTYAYQADVSDIYGSNASTGNITFTIGSYSGAEANLTGCSNITQPGNYTITSNMSGTAGCISLAAPNTNMDCQGNSISGTGAQDSYGIVISSANSTFSNCVFQNWSVDVLVSGASNITLSNISMGTPVGLLVNNTNDSTFTNMAYSNITGEGIWVANNSNRNSFGNVSISATGGHGIYVESGANNTFDCRGGTVSGDNSPDTYGVYSAQPGTVAVNCAIANFTDAVHMAGATYGVYANNTFLSSSNAHVFMDAVSFGNAVYANNFTGDPAYYAYDLNGGNGLNGTVNGGPYGNIYQNVINGSVNVFSFNRTAALVPGLFVGDTGYAYPYNSSNSLGKIYGASADYGPLTLLDTYNQISVYASDNTSTIVFIPPSFIAQAYVTLNSNSSSNMSNGATGFYVRNDGNVNVSVNLNANQDAAAFIGGSSPHFGFMAGETQPGACISGLMTNYTEFNLSIQQACAKLGYVPSPSEMAAYLRIGVPSDSPAHEGYAVIVFTGTPA